MIVKELFAKLGLEVDHGVFNAAEKALGNIKLGTLAIGGAIAAAAGAMYHLMAETRDYAVEASKAAQRTGLTVEAWQEMKAAGEATGMSAETLEHSLILMSKAAYGASQGGEEMAKTFHSLGVKTKDASGHLKAGDELLAELADKFAAMPDGIAKTALATKAFGRSGAEMIPFLNKGAAGIEELRHHAHELGLVLDQETIEAAKKWKQQMREMSERIEGLKLQLGAKLLKAFMSFKTQMGKLFSALSGFFSTLAKHWRETVMVLAAGAAAIILANAGLVGSYLAAGAAAVAAGLRAAASWLLAAAPVVGLIALFVALALLLEDFLKTLDGGDTLLSRYGEKFTKWVDELIKVNPDDFWLVKALKTALQYLTDLQGTYLKFKKALLGSEDASFGEAISGGPKRAPTGGLVGDFKRWTGLEFDASQLMRPPVAAFGGGASPQAAMASASNHKPAFAPTINTTVTVNAQTGADAEDIAHHARRQVEDILDTKLREAAAAAH